MDTSFGTPKSAALKDVVRNFWEVNRKYPHATRETIIPKGSIEIIFNLAGGSPIAATIGNQTLQVPRCFISGYNTVPIQLQLPDSQFFFGVYVHPTSLPKILGIRAEEFANQCIDLTLVDQSFGSLWHELAEQKNFDNRVAVFSTWLMKGCPATSRHEKLFDDFLSGTSTSTTAPELSAWLCYSPRHLSRKLRELTGMNLEQTLLYKKYLQGINLIHHSQLKLTEIAHACDFSDQAHFSRTFKSFARLNPNEYRVLKSNISGHIFQNVR